MGKRVSYPISIKEEAVQMRLAGIPTKEIMDRLGIKNGTQPTVSSTSWEAVFIREMT